MKTATPRGSPHPMLLAVLVLCACGAAMAQENIDPAADGSQYAWGENIGWCNAEPQGDGGPGATVSDTQLTGWIWGENIGWISLSCQNTSSCGDNAYEVANDGCGNLTGYAWGENIGWINFSCLNNATCATADYGVTIDPQTGDFSGRAWGENVGWITFASSGPNPYKVTTSWNPVLSMGSPTFTGLDKVGTDLVLTWSSLPAADVYQVVQGSLSDLRSSGGDFATALSSCTASAGETLVTPLAATTNADFFLVRGVICGGKGSVESGGIGQVGLRDGEVTASPSDCP